MLQPVFCSSPLRRKPTFAGRHEAGRTIGLWWIPNKKSAPALCQAFAAACAVFEAQPAPQPAMDVTFWRSRANGGLHKNGKPAGGQPSTPVGTVTIMGKLAAE